WWCAWLTVSGGRSQFGPEWEGCAVTDRQLTRRQFLSRAAGVGGATALLVACGPAGLQAPIATSAPPAARPTAASAAQPPCSVRFQGMVLPTLVRAQLAQCRTCRAPTRMSTQASTR